MENMKEQMRELENKSHRPKIEIISGGGKK